MTLTFKHTFKHMMIFRYFLLQAIAHSPCLNFKWSLHSSVSRSFRIYHQFASLNLPCYCLFPSQVDLEPLTCSFPLRSLLIYHILVPYLLSTRSCLENRLVNIFTAHLLDWAVTLYRVNELTSTTAVKS